MRKFLLNLVLSGLAALSPLPAMAETITISDPTGISGTLSLSDDLVTGLKVDGVGGSGFNYLYQKFSVSVSGAYSFGVTASNGIDVLLILYQGSFDPNSPGTNGIAANDDTEGDSDPSTNPAYTEGCGEWGYCPSLENIELISGSAYYMVISTYKSGDAVPTPISFYCIGVGECSFAAPSNSALPIMQANQARVTATMDYDCTSFGANGLCVSIGTRSDDLEAADGMLIATHAVVAYRVNDMLRFGGYVDVGVGGLPEGLEYDGVAPVVGAFAGFGNGVGWNGKATVALGFGDVVAEDAEDDAADAVSTMGIDGWVGYAFQLDQNWIVMPVLGLRKTSTSFNDDEETLAETSGNMAVRVSGLIGEGVRVNFSLGADFTLQLEPEVEEHTSPRLFAAGDVAWELSDGLEMSVGGSARRLATGEIGYGMKASLTFAY